MGTNLQSNRKIHIKSTPLPNPSKFFKFRVRNLDGFLFGVCIYMCVFSYLLNNVVFLLGGKRIPLTNLHLMTFLTAVCRLMYC